MKTTGAVCFVAVLVLAPLGAKAALDALGWTWSSLMLMTFPAMIWLGMAGMTFQCILTVMDEE